MVQLVKDNAVVVSYTYDAFGNITEQIGTSENAFLYCGEYFDAETETYYLRARYYDPTSGRFTQQDAWAFMDPSDPLSLNLYTYCFSNPINLTDASGNWPQWLKDIGNGIKDGFVDTFSEIANAIAHPIQTIELIASNPLELLKQGIINTLDPFRFYRITYNLIEGDMYDAGYLYGGNLADATIIAGTLGATKAANAISAKVMPKIVKSELFSVNDGYGIKIGKNIEILYQEPRVDGGTFISYESASKKWRISWDPEPSFHYHSGFGREGRIHRKISILHFGEEIKKK